MEAHPGSWRRHIQNKSLTSFYVDFLAAYKIKALKLIKVVSPHYNLTNINICNSGGKDMERDHSRDCLFLILYSSCSSLIIIFF